MLDYKHWSIAPRPTAVSTPTTLRRLAVLGNHLPRQCGIATFTTDLTEAITAERPELDCFVLAMNDAGHRYAYPPRVRFEIAATDVTAYRRAADYLNVSSVDVVSVQHEYGIFGGKAGAHLLATLRELRMPIVTTLHTILAEPTALQRLAMDELLQLSERVVVMSAHGASLLARLHQVPEEKIDLIPHGIPHIPPTIRGKPALGVAGKSVLLTFGLLSPDKGLEYVIDALPAILERFPNTVYIVLGATHPHVRAQQGEMYRVMLENRARALGVESSVIFHDRFVSKGELTEFLAATDIYITPYLKPEQSTSGTLAYAVGSGRAVISTPYFYARELLADDRGVLVPWRDAAAIARETISLLGDEPRRQALAKRSAAYGRGMLWPQVARSYLRSFERAVARQADGVRGAFQARTLAERPADLPDLNLDHLERMTDGTGMLQHAAFNVPRYADGYCLDDNARALLLTTLLEDAGSEEAATVRSLGDCYLAFVAHAFDTGTGRFRNFMTYERHWVDERGSEDCHGRALWALGAVVRRAAESGQRSLSTSLFHQGLAVLSTFTSPRAWAYALLGIDDYLCVYQGETAVQAIRNQLADRLLALYRDSSSPEWPWFEPRATYCNARLSQALLVSGERMERADLREAGFASLEWLVSVQRTADGTFSPVGSNGFFPRGAEKASFDQQPVEAYCMVSACLLAGRLSGEARWSREARSAFNWFLGHNQLRQPVYDASSGGCRDGLHPDRPNENQGAESTLSYLLALCELRAAAQPELLELAEAPRPLPRPSA